MLDAIALFKNVYTNTPCVEVCIAELKRHGFSRNETMIVLIEVLDVTVVEADQLVMDSMVWHD